MRFKETYLPGAFIIEPEKFEDERGFFARTFCQKEFEAHNLIGGVAQCSVSFNRKKGTLRGMHYQVPPFEESKLVRCIRGSLYDVIIDLRPESKTFRRYLSATLSAENRFSLYVPPRFAHGFQTLEDDTEVLYMISEFYSPGHQRGVRWNDPAFGILWPDGDRIIIDRDQQYPDFSPDCLSAGGQR